MHYVSWMVNYAGTWQVLSYAWVVMAGRNSANGTTAWNQFGSSISNAVGGTGSDILAINTGSS
jgi:hypothetical protein